MSIVVNPFSRSNRWVDRLQELMPAEDVRLWSESVDPTSVEFLVAFTFDYERLVDFERLRAILCTGAGVDQWLHPAVPDVPVVRLADPAMAEEMASYALHWVVRHQRGFDGFADLQRQHRFGGPSYKANPEFCVCVLGYGEIGKRVADSFASLGYSVVAWSRSGVVEPSSHERGSVNGCSSLDGLKRALSSSDAVVSVLPSTAETAGLLNAERLGWFKPDAVFINMGRGTVVDESALTEALDLGHLAHAVLDVTHPEPPTGPELFDHPKITLTGHSAGPTVISTGSVLIAANIERIRNGDDPFPLLDRNHGY